MGHYKGLDQDPWSCRYDVLLAFGACFSFLSCICVLFSEVEPGASTSLCKKDYEQN